MQDAFYASRRTFLKQLTAATLGAPFITRGLLAASPNSQLAHASFGASGMAWADITSLAKHSAVRIVAAADVDLKRTLDFKRTFPDAKVYQDWRELLDKEHQRIDSVNVSTPDHMHGPIAMSALQLGKHVYGQKPLTHDLYETRQLTLMARKKKLVTQMGIQIHSAWVYRLAVKLIQDLAIGKVKEVHTWSNKTWGDPGSMPAPADAVPAEFNWDLWLGVCAERPFIGNGWYHPVNWRKRLDFGTGTFGDMGCHIYDPVFKALALTAPLSVRSEGPAPNAHSWAVDAVIHYLFPGTPYTADKTVAVTWYDGEQRPPADVQGVLGDRKLPDQGSIFLGTKGSMLLPHVDKPVLLPQAQFKDFPLPTVKDGDHWFQFVEACLGQGTTTAGFDYSGPLTETVLLGSVASRFPKTTLEWQAAKLRFTNKEADQYVRRAYRKGWEVKGM